MPNATSSKGTLLALLWGGAMVQSRQGTAKEIWQEAVREAGSVLVVSPAGVGLSLPAGAAHLEGVLSEAPGMASLRLHSLPGLNSLAAVSTPLRLLFPGLRELRRLDTPRLPARHLAAQLAQGRIRLLLDTPGSELDMLAQLEAAGLLERVDDIHLRCTRLAGFENGPDEDALRLALEARLFRLEARRADDPDYPELHFVPDLQARALRRDLADSEEKRLRAEAQNVQTREQSAKDLAEAEARIAEHVAAGDQLREALRLSGEAREQDRLEVSAARESLSAQLSALEELRQRHDRLQEEKSRLEEQNAREQEQIQARATAQIAGQVASGNQLREALRASEEALARSQAAREQDRLDLSFTLENLTAQRAELEDLRQRHGRLHDEKRQLEELIRQLTPRLQEAAEHLRGMPAAEPATPAAGGARRRDSGHVSAQASE